MSFKIVRNDITKIKADAIVNTANPEPIYSAGTDSAVYIAAGAEKLLEERKKIGRIAEGDVAVTPAFDLDAKYIFHTVGPIWQGGDYGEKETVSKCYLNCLNKAKELELESIAFPLLATGTYGFPKADALLIATSVFSSFLAENELEITLVVFDSESFALSDKIFAGVDQFIDENYVDEKTSEEYSYKHIAGAASAMAGAAACAAACAAASEAEPTAEPAGEMADECTEDIADECADVRDEEEAVERRRARRRELIERDSKERRGLFGLRNKAAVAECAAPPVAEEENGDRNRFTAKAAAPRSLDDVVKNVSETWQESLLRMITEKGYTDTEVYKRANVDRKLFSKIRSNKEYQPKKNTAVAFALALRLNLDETKDFLRRAGYAFSPSSKFDLIIEYSIDHGVYDLMLINCALFDHDQPLLGA